MYNRITKGSQGYQVIKKVIITAALVRQKKKKIVASYLYKTKQLYQCTTHDAEAQALNILYEQEMVTSVVLVQQIHFSLVLVLVLQFYHSFS